jgi:hypothetical protein
VVYGQSQFPSRFGIAFVQIGDRLLEIRQRLVQPFNPHRHPRPNGQTRP